MELSFIILAIGIAFWINQPSIDKDKLKLVIKSIDTELNKEFTKRDNKIKELENRIKILEGK